MIRNRPAGGDPPPEMDEATHYVLGDDHVSVTIAERLYANSYRVAVVNELYDGEGVPGATGDPADTQVLSEAGIGTDSTVIAGTRSDRRNLLLAQLVRAHFDVPRVIAFVEEPEYLSLFAEAGHEPLCSATALSEALIEVI